MKSFPKIVLNLIVSFLLLSPFAAQAQRQMEKLGRGVVALRTSSTQVYVGWRLLGNDPDDIAFNVYRSANGATAVKINGTTPITATTDFVDTTANLTGTNTYSVKPVLKISGTNVEVPDTWANLTSVPFTLPALAPDTLPPNAPTRQYVPVPLKDTPDDTATVSYKVKFCWVGDLDGDGEYDFVVDRYNPTVDARQWLQAYKRDGTLLWQANMGPNSVDHYNITPGSSTIGIGHGDNVTVYDLDGDGKAEVIVRTANGVVITSGTGTTQVASITAASNETQFISIIDGMTGVEKARATVPVPNTWATQTHMNGHMGIVYADGMKPSVIWQSSNRNTDLSFNDVVTAWDYRNGALTQRWTWPFTGHSPTAHQIRLADVDNDGKDEYEDIGLVLKADGSAQINAGVLNEVIHGDRFHISDIDPDRPGLETYLIQQNNGTGLATVLQSADKSLVIKKWYAGAVVDVGRGVIASLDPNIKGMEMFSTQGGIFDPKGNLIIYDAANPYARPFPPETIWWDSDLAREFVSTIGSTAESPGIDKFNTSNPGGSSRLISIYSDSAAPTGNYIAYGGRPAFWGDILGDWREELLCVANDNSELRIYTTKIPDAAKTSGTTPFRIYTLMHNPQYRIQTTTKGYVQSSYVDYYLGYGMTPPQPPPMVDTKLVWRGGAGTSTWDVGTQSWLNSGTNSTYGDGDTVRFDISGNNTTNVVLSGTLQPGLVTVYSPKSYTFDGSGGALSGTTKLTKAGSGTLTISGTHSYTGRTTVWDGALIVNGDLQQSPVTVWGGTWGGALAGGATGGRIGGTGRFSQPVIVRYRGTVVPGAGMNSAGTVTFGSGLTAENGSTFALDLSDDPTGVTHPSDLIAITGNLALSGTVRIVVKPLNGALSSGTYTLATYTGALTGGTSNLAVTLPAGIPYTLAAGSGAITLAVPVTRAAANVTWRGSGGTWDIATSQNWLRTGTADVFVSGDSVAFDDTGAAKTTVTLTGASPVSGVTVNTGTNYTFTGSGAISGTGGLIKSGTGTLTINTTNDYTGPTAINGGVLAVTDLNDGGAASSLGAASTSASNLVINGGTLRLTGLQTNTNRNATLGASGGTFDVASASSSLQISGTIAGSGSLTKTGPGTLILANANSYSGNTVLNNGTIYLAGSTPNTSGLGSGSVTINNGTLTMSDVQASENAAWNIIVPTGAVARLNADGRCSLSGSLTGGGDFTFWTGYIRTDLNGNWSAFTGRIFAVSDSTGGDFRASNTNGYPNCELNLGNNVYAYSLKGGTLNIGALTGGSLAVIATNTGGSGKQTTWVVGGLNRSTTFAGSILETAALTKTGTATLTLSGSNNYSGATTVSAGTLLVSGSITSASNLTVQNTSTLNLSAGTLTLPTTTINSGGTLTGCGVINGALVNNGTIVSNCGGALTVSGNVTNNGTMHITNGTTIVASGVFTNNGVLDLITSGQTLPANFVNHGTVLDASAVKVQTASLASNTFTVTIKGYGSHTYTMQSTASLSPANWQNVGVSQSVNPAQVGSIPLTFTDGSATGASRFYRIVVSP